MPFSRHLENNVLKIYKNLPDFSSLNIFCPNVLIPRSLDRENKYLSYDVSYKILASIVLLYLKKNANPPCQSLSPGRCILDDCNVISLSIYYESIIFSFKMLIDLVSLSYSKYIS